MAIAFHCPHCTAAIRVPDSAGGKRGTCPQCGTKLIVPRVEVPVEDEMSRPRSAPAGTGPIGPSELDEMDETIDYAPGPETPPSSDGPSPVDSPESSREDEGPRKEKRFSELSPAARRALRASRASREKKKRAPVAQRVRRRRRRRTGWTVPLLFVGLLAAAVGWIAWQNRPRIAGALQAQQMPQLEPEAGLVERALIELPAETVDATLARLAKQPEVLTSNLMRTEFRGSADGLRVQLHAGRETQFYRVPIHDDKAVDAWFSERARQLENARVHALRAAATDFVATSQKSQEADAPLRDLAKYRDSLGLNALVGGVGFAVVAVRAGQIHRCVFEDVDGNVYFLLPKKTDRFEIRGRELPGGEEVFPGQLVVTVDEQPVFDTPKARTGGEGGGSGRGSDDDIPGMAVRYGLEKKKSPETKDGETMTGSKNEGGAMPDGKK